MSAPVRSNSVSACGAGRRDRDLEALLAQHVGQRVGERLLVLDHQHAGHQCDLLRFDADDVGALGVDLNAGR